ncbi:helix-turn-helix domain-containing protein [Paenibacillus sepulcri]|uniref:Response regulator n=1 Tax=Paenibacillus sepulcri TaxID=359917 RepID=A0ABS7C2Q7_9BACL|nr:response regulator [Paenibacillus sepulcri]
MKLLIADDQASLHTFLDKMVDWLSLGITEIRHAYDSKETLLIIEQFMPDLLILDVQMPFMNGLEMLKQLKQPFRKPKTVILSAYDEFEFAREALHLSVAQYLLKPVDVALLTSAIRELLASIQDEQQAALAHELGRIVQSLSCPAESFEVIGRSFQALQIREYMLLDVDGGQPSAESLIEWISGLEDAIIPVVHRKSPDGYACLLGMTAPVPAMRLEELYRQLSDQWIERFADSQASIGISAVADTPDRLLELYRQSEEAGLQRFYSQEAVNLYKEGYFTTDWRTRELQKYERALPEQVSYGFQSASVSKLVSGLFDHFREKRLHPENVYMLILHYVYITGQALNDSVAGKTEWAGITLDMLKAYRTADRLEHYLQALLHRIADKSETAPLAGETVLQVKHFVDLHYGEDLSLQRIATLFNMDKFQLSRAFKQELHINYWTYVMQARMSKAAEMLVNTEMKNSAIAAATGFGDESHFSRSFKKHFDLSPKQYRQAKTGAEGGS